MNEKISRREFVDYLSTGTAGFLALPLFTGGCEQIADSIANRPVRKMISSLSSTDPIIQGYNQAVQAMKALASSDPRNWTKQAEIHYNHCPHGNWFFLPWHRAYLFYFEEICREMIGDDDFALPYWNWTANPQIPTPFWSGSLNDSTRTATSSSTASSSAVGPSVLENILDETNFEQFASYKSTAPRGGTGGGYGSLEQTPHNYIHGFVGGNMATFMSPLDPIFWTHHCMIDCCWANWNIERGNPNTNDPDLMQYTFTNNFVDRSGNSVNIMAATTVLMPLLSYRYQESQKGESVPPTRIRQLDSLRLALEKGALFRARTIEEFNISDTVATNLDQPVNKSLALENTQLKSMAAQDGPGQVYVTVSGVEPPKTGEYFVRVFLNMPEATRETSTDDPHYAGSFYFFHDPARGSMKHDYIVNVTNTVRALSKSGELVDADSLNVNLVAIPDQISPQLESSPKQLTFNKLQLKLMDIKVEPGNQE